MLKLVFSPRRVEIPKPNGFGTKFSSRAFLEKMLPGEKTNAIGELQDRIDCIEKRIIHLRQTPGTNERTIGILKSMKSACRRDLKIVQSTEPVKITDEGIFRGTEITKTDYSNWQKTGSKKH